MRHLPKQPFMLLLKQRDTATAMMPCDCAPANHESPFACVCQPEIAPPADAFMSKPNSCQNTWHQLHNFLCICWVTDVSGCSRSHVWLAIWSKATAASQAFEGLPMMPPALPASHDAVAATASHAGVGRSMALPALPPLHRALLLSAAQAVVESSMVLAALPASHGALLVTASRTAAGLPMTPSA